MRWACNASFAYLILKTIGMIVFSALYNWLLSTKYYIKGKKRYDYAE